MLRKFNVVPSKIGGRHVQASAFDAPTENMRDITPLLYQSGYITIKDYNCASRLYTLDIPNTEIRVGLMVFRREKVTFFIIDQKLKI